MDAWQNAALWSSDPVFDADTRAEAAKIMQNEQDTLSAFGVELTFGTGGLRGILGVGTNRMNRYTVARATRGLCDYLLKGGKKSVAISHDSRIGSREFALIAAGVFAQGGITAYLYDRLMPTPALSFAVRHLGCDAGVMITASHNPAQYNGYKVYGADGCQITDEAADAITACIDAVTYPSLAWMDEQAARHKGLLQSVPDATYQAFIDEEMKLRVETQPITLPLVYTPLYGTGLEPVRDVLRRAGASNVTEVTEQCTPNGHFPTCPKPNPELREALTLALEAARKSDAALLIATDPDCDRVGVAVKNAQGDYTVLTGNEVGLLLLEYLLKRKKALGALPQHPVIVKTIVTSDLTFAIAKAFGLEVEEVLTGFKYIGEKIGKLEKVGEANRYLFGFEESCGYLSGTHVRDKDAVNACLLVADMAQHYFAQGQSLLDVLAELYQTYGCMQNRLLNFDIEAALPMEKMNAILAQLRAEAPTQLCDEVVCEVRDYAGGFNGLPKSNVLSYLNARGDKAIVRPSGTEPKVKVYLSANRPTLAEAQAALDTMQKQAERWILG